MTWSISKNGEGFGTWYGVAIALRERHVLDSRRKLWTRMPVGQIVGGRGGKFSSWVLSVRSCRSPLRILLRESYACRRRSPSVDDDTDHSFDPSTIDDR